MAVSDLQPLLEGALAADADGRKTSTPTHYDVRGGRSRRSPVIWVVIGGRICPCCSRPTFQIEFFTFLERRVEFAEAEIAVWPSTKTKDLGMNERTRFLAEVIVAGESVLDHRLAKRPQGEPSTAHA